MALGTVTTLSSHAFGNLALHIVDVQLTAGANYTTNGEPFDTAQIPNAKGALLAVIPQPGASVGGNSATVMWDPANKKLKAYGTGVSATGLTEIANAVNLSAQTARLLCLTNSIG